MLGNVTTDVEMVGSRWKEMTIMSVKIVAPFRNAIGHPYRDRPYILRKFCLLKIWKSKSVNICSYDPNACILETAKFDLLCAQGGRFLKIFD